MARLNVSKKGLAAMAGTSLALMLAACGDGTPTPGKADVASCASSNSCAPSGPATTGSAPAPLCPAALDYATVYTGGTGAGEFVKMQFDTTAMTYRLQVIESPVPKATKSVSPTRAGVTFTGTIAHLTSLPTAEQNRCALVLQSATPSDNASQAIIDPHSPPVIFVGNGVAGGGVPGATISFDGILGFGVIPEKTFPIYPVLAFAQTETDFAKVAGSYNVLGYHQVPSGGALAGGTNFAPATAQAAEVLKTDGSCSASAGSCVTTGNPWATRAQNDGAFESNNAGGNLRYPAFYNKAITSGNSSRAKGVLVVGKLNGALVPLLIRVGFAQADSIVNVNVDDESGLAMLAPTTNLTNAQLNGAYVGSGSDLAYTLSLVQGNAVGLLDPLTMNTKGGYQLDLTQTKPGLVTTVDNSGTTGALISTGHVFAHLAGTASSNPSFRVSVFASP